MDVCVVRVRSPWEWGAAFQGESWEALPCAKPVLWNAVVQLGCEPSLVLEEPAVLEAVLGAGLACRGVRQRKQGEIRCRGEIIEYNDETCPDIPGLG